MVDINALAAAAAVAEGRIRRSCRSGCPGMIVACESGKQDGAPSEGIDAEIYNTFFATEFPQVRFISIGSTNDMKGDRFLVVQAAANLIEGSTVIRLIDRDGMSDSEIAEHEKAGCQVLRKRHLEAYLFDDDVLRRLCEKEGPPEKGRHASNRKK